MKQKFFEVYNRYYKRSDKLDIMVELADDYAIEFAEWILKKYLSPSLDDLYVNDKGDLISVKELLVIFKQL